MKVAINKCFGGFGLSPKAIELYTKYKTGKQAYHFNHNYIDGDFNKSIYTPLKDDERSLFSHSFDVPNPNEIDQDTLWKDHYLTSSIDHEDRADPILIKVIEELGSKLASGDCAELAIVEVPDDVQWHISDYDGNERVEENHRSW